MSKANYQSKSASVAQNLIDISVVVPFYNAEKHIRDCISALLSQNYPASRYEIIMVDNNSKDKTAQIIKKYPRIKLLAEKSQGSYAARNRGVAESRGGIIAFTDSDCVPDPEWLNKISESLRSSGVGIVQGGRFYASGSSALSVLAAYESERADYTFSGKSNGLYYGYTNNMAVRRDLFDRCGPFLEVGRGADSIFVNRAVEEYSSQIIRYMHDAKIQHSEITSVVDYFGKKFIYGRSFQQNYSQRKNTHRNMTLTERYRMIKRTIQQNCFSIPQSISLVFLIMIGMISFRFGRLSVSFETIRKWFSARTRWR